MNIRNKGGMAPIKGGHEPLICSNPDLAKEWDYEKNAPLKPDDVSAGSQKKVWWNGKCGHSWNSLVCNRVRWPGCPYCSNKKVLAGFNDLATTNPELLKEWDYQSNVEISPQDIMRGSTKKVGWICRKGHRWMATVNSRTNLSGESGCPVCSGHQLLLGYNDLATTNPELISEWDYQLNTDISPEGVTKGSNRKVSWICNQGHRWMATVCSRTNPLRKSGCPVCAGLKLFPGFNDLASKRPDLIQEWDYEKNFPLLPEQVTVANNRKVWWKCKSYGHSFQTMIASRTTKDIGCPICSGHQVLSGFNDLATTNPELSNEWNYEKNGELKPTDVTRSSGKKVWWICNYGHEWRAVIGNRNIGTGCPVCNNKSSSMPEQGIAYYLKKCCCVKQRIKIDGNEVDVYLPEYNIGIEYDGAYFHQDDSKDTIKDKKLHQSGLVVIRIKESDYNHISPGGYIYYQEDNMGVNYEWALRSLFNRLVEITKVDLFATLGVDIKRDRIKIREQYDLMLKEDSLLEKYPEIAAEWDSEKNGILTPEMFMSKSSIKVYWICPQGHSYEATISSRTNKKTGCPICAGKKVLKGYNDLLTIDPLTASEWDYEKNKGIVNKKKEDISTPDKVTVSSGYKVWWICRECKNEYYTTISGRHKGHGCPKCANRKRGEAGEKPVINLDTGVVYKSISDAQKATGAKGISSVCTGRRKSAGGYRWKFID